MELFSQYGRHFGWPKITFYRISRHFSSIHNFFYIFFCIEWPSFWITDKSLLIAFLAISDQCTTFISSQNVFRRPFWMTENHFQLHFISIHNFYFLEITEYAHLIAFQFNTQLLFHKMAFRRPFWMTENHFGSHFSQFQINIFTNGCRRPFWMTKNHFWSNLSPFQINT